MRKVLLYICSVFILGGMTSCEDFLDKREDVGLTEDDIFRDYYSLRGFLDQSFNQLENVMVMDNWENGRAFVGLFADEMATTDNSSAVFTLHSGDWLSNQVQLLRLATVEVQLYLVLIKRYVSIIV